MKKLISIILLLTITLTGCSVTEKSPTISEPSRIIDLGDINVKDESYRDEVLEALWPGELTNEHIKGDMADGTSTSKPIPEAPKSNDTNSTVQRIVADLNASRSKYDETYGWIYVSGTKIDYPIMQSTNNTKYLKKDRDLNYAYDGSIFADYENGKDPQKEKNLVIYGHNMNSNTMFGTLMNLKNEDMFKDSLIYIFANNKVYIYQPFAEFTTRTDFSYNVVKFNETNDFSNMIRKMKDKSLVKSNLVVGEKDSIVTLSTCTNNYDDERYAVVGKLISVMEV